MDSFQSQNNPMQLNAYKVKFKMALLYAQTRELKNYMKKICNYPHQITI